MYYKQTNQEQEVKAVVILKIDKIDIKLKLII